MTREIMYKVSSSKEQLQLVVTLNQLISYIFKREREMDIFKKKRKEKANLEEEWGLT